MNKNQKFNICLVAPDNYVHSLAFLELGELIHYSLKELGLQTKIAFNNIESDQKNILIGCHLLNPSLISQLPRNTIILNTEQIYKDDTPWNQTIFDWAAMFDVWDYSIKNIEKFNSLGINNVQHFQIGFQQELSRIVKAENQDIDVLFYGSINDRRKIIIDALIKNGLKVKTLFGVYGKSRDEWISRSKIVLNHHFYHSQIFEVIRVFYLLTNSVAVMGEVNETTWIPAAYKAGICAAKYEDLIEKCMDLINNQVKRKALQENALESISRHPQKLFMSELLAAKE